MLSRIPVRVVVAQHATEQRNLSIHMRNAQSLFAGRRGFDFLSHVVKAPFQFTACLSCVSACSRKFSTSSIRSTRSSLARFMWSAVGAQSFGSRVARVFSGESEAFVGVEVVVEVGEGFPEGFSEGFRTSIGTVFRTLSNSGTRSQTFDCPTPFGNSSRNRRSSCEMTPRSRDEATAANSRAAPGSRHAGRTTG